MEFSVIQPDQLNSVPYELEMPNAPASTGEAAFRIAIDLENAATRGKRAPPLLRHPIHYLSYKVIAGAYTIGLASKAVWNNVDAVMANDDVLEATSHIVFSAPALP